MDNTNYIPLGLIYKESSLSLQLREISMQITLPGIYLYFPRVWLFIILSFKNANEVVED